MERRRFTREFKLEAVRTRQYIPELADPKRDQSEVVGGSSVVAGSGTGTTLRHRTLPTAAVWRRKDKSTIERFHGIATERRVVSGMTPFDSTSFLRKFRKLSKMLVRGGQATASRHELRA
jgi:hypothetical protein